MHAVEGPDAVDVETVEVMEFEKERVAIGQRAERLLERLLVCCTIPDLQVVQLRIDGARELELLFCLLHR